MASVRSKLAGKKRRKNRQYYCVSTALVLSRETSGLVWRVCASERAAREKEKHARGSRKPELLILPADFRSASWITWRGQCETRKRGEKVRRAIDRQNDVCMCVVFGGRGWLCWAMTMVACSHVAAKRAAYTCSISLCSSKFSLFINPHVTYIAIRTQTIYNSIVMRALAVCVCV